MKRFNKNNFTIAGATFKTRNGLITVAISVACLAIFLALDLLGVNFSWYGLLMGVAFLVAIAFSCKYCAYRDLDSNLPYDLIWFIFPLSLLGARLYFCLFNGSMASFFDFSGGGLAVYGGIIGGAIGLVICCLIKKINILKTMDIVAPVLLLGQGIGRIGCYTAGCCYGIAVESSAMQWFPLSYFVAGDWHLATFFYEFVLCVIGFFVLAYLLRRFKHTGLVTCSYLFYYGIVRYFTESLRDSNAQLQLSGGTPISMIVSLILLVLGTIGIVIILLKERNKNN